MSSPTTPTHTSTNVPPHSPFHLQFRYTKLHRLVAVKVPGDQSIALSIPDTPSPPLALDKGRLGGPVEAQTLEVGAMVAHHLFHQAEVDHCRVMEVRGKLALTGH